MRLTGTKDECRRRNYIPELVYLLSVTGQTKSALHLIIDELGDVPMAISFVKEVDEKSLWGDLLDYGMDKPSFIRGLLEDVGTSIDPVTLVRRIPDGLQIEGLKDSLGKLLRESEITWSISNGASRVLQAEISTVMDELRRRRECGVVFDVGDRRIPHSDSKTGSGKCEVCDETYQTEFHEPDSEERLIGFLCGHIYHLSCLLDEIEDDNNRPAVEKLRKDLAEDGDGMDTIGYKRGGVGLKMRHVQMIKGVLNSTTCLSCRQQDKDGSANLGAS